MSNFFVIDRFEGDYAILERGEEIFDVPKSIFPIGVREGDVVEIKITSGRRRENYEDLFEKGK